MALKNVFLLFVLSCLIAYATAARNDLSSIKPADAGQDDAADRLKECLNGTKQSQSCSNAYVKFFLTGQINNLIAECCGAVDIMISKCLPAMPIPQQGNKLKAFCNGASAPAASSTVS